MRVNLIGPMFSTSGYANHFRGLANALGKLIDVKITTQLFPQWELQCNDLELDMINKQDDKDRANLLIDLPMNWKQYASKKQNVAWLVWEGDKIPLSWLDCIADQKITRVLVPSAHVYDAIKNTATNEWWMLNRNKIGLVPHGINLNIFRPLDINKELFTFICNKGFRGELDRGGLQHSIRAFISEFNKGEARMLVKLNPAYAIGPAELNILLEKYRLEEGKSMEKMPEIMFHLGVVSPKEIADIYNAGHVFVNSTEGEAFSLPSLEAMGCGLSVIATNFGGQIDFVNGTNGYLIDYDLKPVEHELMYQGVSWARPRIPDLRRLMRLVKEDLEITKIKGENALKTAKQYTWENSAQKLIELLKQ